MIKNALIYFTLINILFLVSCEKDDETGDNGLDLIKITTALTDDQSFEVELFAMDTLFEGYNELFLRVKELESGNYLDEASLKLKPMMDMITMKHSAPCEDPMGVVNETGYHECAVVFIMPSTPDMAWTVDVTVEATGIESAASLDIPVVLSLEEARKINVISKIDEVKYFVSLVAPMDPEVGINDCEFTVHYKESMMSFPPAEDLTVEIEPEMPSMDHGSPNNVDPVHTSLGHYTGKLNFTMTGWWRIHITLKKNGEIISDEAYMDITLN